MAIGKEIKVVLSLDDKGFKVGIRDASGELRNFEQRADQAAKSVKNIEGSVTSFGAKAHQMISTLGMARFALMDIYDIFLRFPLAVLKASGEVERLTRLMEGLSTETDKTKRALEAASNVKFLFNMAQNAPFEIKALSDAFIKFKTGGLDPTNGSLQALVDSVARFGGSSEALKRASIAIQQMAGKGVVSMEELRQQLGEAVPTAMNAMAQGMGISMAELTKRVSTGTVGATTAISKMLAVMHVENAGAAARMMDTWTGMIERLKTKWELFKLDVGGEGMFAGSKKALDDLLKMFDSNSGTSFARSLGQSLDSAATSVVSLTKKIIELRDWIVTAGKVYVAYFLASRVVAPMLSGGANLATDLVSSIKARINAAQTAANEERLLKQKQILEDAAFLEQKIAANNAEIVAEQRKAQALREVQQQELRDQIRANQAKTAAQEMYIVESIAAERALLAHPAHATRNVPGMQTQAQRDELNALQRTADATRDAANAAKDRIRVLQDQNREMTQHVSSLSKSAAVESEGTLAKKALNAELQNEVSALRQTAENIGKTNTAWATMKNVASGVVSSIGSMVFSMNGLVVAITAALYVWDQFREKAKQAANEAQTALDFTMRLERGNVDNEANQELVNQIAREQRDVPIIEAKLRELAARRKLALKRGMDVTDLDNEVAETQKKQKELLGRIAENQANLTKGLLQAAQTEIQQAANDMAAKARDDADAVVRKFDDAKAEIQKRYDDLASKSGNGKLTKGQDEQLNKELRDQNLKALEAERAFLRQQAESWAKAAQDVTRAGVERQRYAKAAELLNKQIADTTGQILALKKPDDVVAGKDKKGPAFDETDALLNKYNADAAKIIKLLGKLKELSGDLKEVADIRAQVEDEIAFLVDADRKKNKVHSKQDETDTIEQGVQLKILDQAVREHSAIVANLKKIAEERRQLQSAFEDGSLRVLPKGAEDAILVMLKRQTAGAYQDTEEFKRIIADRQTLLKEAAGKDADLAALDNEKRLRNLRVQVNMDAREQIMAQGRQEVEDVEWKYKVLIERQKQYGGDTTRLERQRTEELELLAKKQAKALETPLQKLAREWQNAYAQMNQATVRWSQGFLQTLRDALITGRADWKKFLAGMLTDILDMQLKQGLGNAVTSGFQSAGNWLMQNVFGEKKADGDAAADADVALANVAESGKAAAGALDGHLTNAVGNATKGVAESMSVGSAKMSAERWATMWLENLATAAQDAAMALAQMSGGSGGGFLGDLAGAFASAYLGGGANPATDPSAAATTDTWVHQVGGGEGLKLKGYPFAEGGVMSSLGPLPLRMYAKGGIAKSPQLAVYGEGSMNEAYVPLPDGRTIPVTIKGDVESQPAAPAVTVNVINQSGQQMAAQQGQPRFDGKQMVLDVVLTAVNQPGPFRTGMQQALK